MKPLKPYTWQSAILALTGILFASALHASPILHNPHLELDPNFSIKKLSDGWLITNKEFESGCADIKTELHPMTELLPDGIKIALDVIELLGRKIWAVVDAGRPVVHVKTPAASALPRGVKCWLDMENWQAPRSATYQVSYKNLLGSEVVKFQFKVIYAPGGQYAGVGRYLANMTIVPSDLQVSWGFSFSAETEVHSPINLGTQENPVAGAQLQLNWTIKGVLNEIRQSAHYFVNGHGEVTVL